MPITGNALGWKVSGAPHLSQSCQQLAGSPLPGGEHSTAAACLWEGWKPDPATSLFPSSLRLPLPFPRVQAVAKGLSRQGTGVREKTGRLEGPGECPFSLFLLPPKLLVLEGDLDLCKGPMWFAKGAVGNRQKHIYTHTAWTPIPPDRSGGYSGFLPGLGLCRVGTQKIVGDCDLILILLQNSLYGILTCTHTQSMYTPLTYTNPHSNTHTLKPLSILYQARAQTHCPTLHPTHPRPVLTTLSSTHLV